MRSTIFTLVALLPTAFVFGADNWPQFRGPQGDGHAETADPPLTWSETSNVKWKTAIHDRGWSSPVIWEDQVWLTTASEEGERLFAVCIDRNTGRVVHDLNLLDVENPEPIAKVNSYASPTPVIEAGRVYLHFGTYGTACVDTKTGRRLWARRDLNCDHHEGPGASPILFGNLLIFTVDGRDVQYVVALDKTSGETVWKTERSIDYSIYNHNFRKAYCMPRVIQWDGRLELVSPGAKAVMGYDPNSGEELWKVRYNGWSVTPGPIFGHGLLFVVTDFVHPELWAIRPGGRGDVSDTHVVWKLTRSIPKAPSLLLIDELLFFVTDGGTALCVEAKTGRLIWQERLGGEHWASPMFAGGNVYFFGREGVATVVEPGRQYKPLASNRLDGECMASPAAIGKSLIVRTGTHLYRIESR